MDYCNQVRILHVIDELKLGGAGVHLATMIEHAVKHHPSVQHHALALFGDGVLSARLERAGCPVRVAGSLSDVRQHRYGRALVRVRAAVRDVQPDVVEAHLTWSRLLALRAARREGVPVRIGYEHGDLFLRSPRIRLANFVLQHDAQRVIVCSNAIKRWAHRTHGFSWARLLVMHNCIDTAHFAPRAQSDHDRFGFDAGTVLFVAVGTLGRGVNKRVDVCIDAVLQCKAQGLNVGLVVCGDGSQRAVLEARAGAEAGRAIRFLGEREDVAEILSRCDVFCHGASFEPFGIVCVEAMAAGLPVLVPDGGGMHEAVSDGVTGFVYRSLDVPDLAEKMRRLAQDVELRRRMGEKGRAQAVSRFEIADYMERLLSMYRDLLSLSPSSRTSAA